jgi:hypothetical protein
MNAVRVPAEHGGTLAAPDFDAWPALAEASQEHLRGASAELRDLRACARRELLELVGRSGRRLVMTGHAPIFYHPGIWSKRYFVARACASIPDAVGVDLMVDTDVAAGLELRIPALSGDGPRVEAVWSPPAADRGKLLAEAAAPSTADIASAIARTEAALVTLGEHGGSARAAFARFAEAARREDLPDRAAAWMGAVLDRFEGSSGARLARAACSALARGEAFRRFFAAVVADAARFARSLNEHLRLHRASHRIRSRTHPFPDLEIDGDCIELPFWCVEDGRRSSTYLVGDEIVVRDRRVAAAELDDIQLAPKALALTMFTRMFVADLFVHGTGGASYDRVTDLVARDIFGVPPPPYVTASATLMLDPASPPPPDVADDLQRLRRPAVRNDPALASEIERRVAKTRRKAAEHEMLVSREHPYCLFLPEEMRRIVEDA